MAYQLRVDWIACEGYGLCGDYAPSLVDLDDWRYPILRDGAIEGSLLHDAQQIVDCCPVKALRLERAADDPSRNARRTPILSGLLRRQRRSTDP